MSSPSPLRYRYQGDGEFKAVNDWVAKKADDQFVVGEVYVMEVRDQRSMESHNHQFAWLHDAWLSLPESQRDRFLDEDQLRYFALIKGGFCNKREIVCGTQAEAKRWMKILSEDDPYSLFTVEQATITCWTAQSQSFKSMDAKRFAASKTAVMEYVAHLLDVTPETLEKQGGSA